MQKFVPISVNVLGDGVAISAELDLRSDPYQAQANVNVDRLDTAATASAGANNQGFANGVFYHAAINNRVLTVTFDSPVAAGVFAEFPVNLLYD